VPAWAVVPQVSDQPAFGDYGLSHGFLRGPKCRGSGRRRPCMGRGRGASPATGEGRTSTRASCGASRCRRIRARLTNAPVAALRIRRAPARPPEQGDARGRPRQHATPRAMATRPARR